MSSYSAERFAQARQALATADAQPGRKLGSIQRGVLQALVQHRVYSLGCGWVWDTHLQTVKVLDTLVKRGLVEREDRTENWGYRNESVRTHSTYRPAAFLTEEVSAR